MRQALFDTLSAAGDIAILVGIPTVYWIIHRLRTENQRLKAIIGRKDDGQTPV